jgi:hypothetical protein
VYFFTKDQYIAFISHFDTDRKGIYNYNGTIYCCNISEYEKLKKIKDNAYELLDNHDELRIIGPNSTKPVKLAKKYNYKTIIINDLETMITKLNKPLIEYVIKINVRVLLSTNIINNIYRVHPKSKELMDITSKVHTIIMPMDKDDQSSKIQNAKQMVIYVTNILSNGLDMDIYKCINTQT